MPDYMLQIYTTQLEIGLRLLIIDYTSLLEFSLFCDKMWTDVN